MTYNSGECFYSIPFSNANVAKVLTEKNTSNLIYLDYNLVPTINLTFSTNIDIPYVKGFILNWRAVLE